MPSKRMTLEQFLVALERTTRGPKALKWRVERFIRGWRGRRRCHCPITAVAEASGYPCFPMQAETVAIVRLHIEPALARRIMEAADATERYPRLRRRLLKALHLTEVEHG